MPTNKRERQRENRAKKLEEQQKLERQRKLRKRATQIGILVGLLAIALLVPMLFSNPADSGDPGDSTTTTPTTLPPTTLDAAALPGDYDGYRAQPTACGAEAPPPLTEMNFDGAVDQGIAPDAVVTATITTSCGEIVAQLDPATAPETVNSFVFLAREGYFDGSAFHRIVPDFVIQGGDPTAVGNGGPGYLVADEFPEPGFVYSRGVLAMANGGANSTGSQFFVVTADDAGLDPLYSVFGTVVDSDETLDRISAVRLTGRDGTGNTEPSLPLETVYIEKIGIEVGN